MPGGRPATVTAPGSSKTKTRYARAWRRARPELHKAQMRRDTLRRQARLAAALTVAKNHAREFEAAIKIEREKRGLDA